MACITAMVRTKHGTLEIRTVEAILSSRFTTDEVSELVTRFEHLFEKVGGGKTVLRQGAGCRIIAEHGIPVGTSGSENNRDDDVAEIS